MSISNDQLMDAMIQIHQGIYKLMELLKEHEFPQFSNGVQRYHSEQGKLPFQVATQFDQPAEFLQSPESVTSPAVAAPSTEDDLAL